jgi:hypothetical protein
MAGEVDHLFVGPGGHVADLTNLGAVDPHVTDRGTGATRFVGVNNRCSS